MEPKFDLKRMLEEIKEDEQASPPPARKMSQSEIRDRVLRKREEEESGGEP